MSRQQDRQARQKSAQRIEIIREDMQALANKHGLEFVYKQLADGTIVMDIAVMFTPRTALAAAAPAAPKAPEDPPT